MPSRSLARELIPKPPLFAIAAIIAMLDPDIESGGMSRVVDW
jgi:hypothetical protein